jgi:hypothetical protein
MPLRAAGTEEVFEKRKLSLVPQAIVDDSRKKWW